MPKFIKSSLCLVLVFLLLSQPCFALGCLPIVPTTTPALPPHTNFTIKAEFLNKPHYSHPISSLLFQACSEIGEGFPDTIIFQLSVGIPTQIIKIHRENSPSKLMFPPLNLKRTRQSLWRALSFHKFGAHFIYDGDQIIEERNSAGQLISQYTFGIGIDEILKMTRNGNDYYYHYDGLGSVTDITDSTNNVVESYSYDVYGQPNQLSTIGNRFYFTGREFDSETGLYYLRNRFYNPTIGRFLQRDPITWGPDDLRSLSFSGADYEVDKAIAKGLGLDDKTFNANLKLVHSVPSLINRVGANNPSLLHLYLYATNNPVNWIDPFGFDIEPEPPSVEEEALIPVPIWEDPSFILLTGFRFRWQPLHIGFDIPFTKWNIIHFGRDPRYGSLGYHLGVLFRGWMKALFHINI